MPELLHVVILVVALPLLVALAWVNLKISRYFQKRNRDHPETRPHGKALLLRLAPFVALLAAGAVWGLVEGEPVLAVICLLGVAGFSVDAVRNWHPPT